MIDDDAAMLRLLQRLLAGLGCIPIAATSASAAREIIAKRPHLSVVMVDLSLPDADGIALIAELKAILGEAAPPFVVLTGRDTIPTIPGVMRVLRKPVSVLEIMQSVKDAVRQKKHG
ncbi:MAG: response regulator [Sandaracinaceae bacterium]|nr:response regulator [Sandaracinaceae bacterium]